MIDFLKVDSLWGPLEQACRFTVKIIEVVIGHLLGRKTLGIAIDQLMENCINGDLWLVSFVGSSL
jgi:hypothetical protein